MRSLVLVSVFAVSGCYLSHERMEPFVAPCEDRFNATPVGTAMTTPIGREEIVGRFRLFNGTGTSQGIIIARVAFEGLFSLPAPARVRVLTGGDTSETPLFEGEVAGPGDVLPTLGTPLADGVDDGGTRDLFVLMDTAGLTPAMQLRVVLTSVLFGSPLDPFQTCGDPVVGPTMTFVDACPTPGSGTFSFDPPGVGPGRGCLTTGAFPRRDFCGPLAAGDLVKGSLHTVYVIGRDGRRHTFPSDMELRSWLGDPDALGIPGDSIGGAHLCSTVPQIPDEDLSALMLDIRNVTIRPGIHILQIGGVPDQYWLVSRGGVLRPVSRDIARRIYGTSFDRRIYLVPDAFFGSYVLGMEITSPDEYDAAAEAATTLLDDLDAPR